MIVIGLKLFGVGKADLMFVFLYRLEVIGFYCYYKNVGVVFTNELG